MRHHVRKVGFCAMLLSVALFARTATADVKLPSLFGDNMVLQLGAPTRVWGWADPGEEVSVTVGKHTARGTANADGRFEIKLPSPDTAGPIAVTVQGQNVISLKNALVGEVWIGSGQSNMFWPVGASMDAKQEIAAASYPEIRLFSVPLKVDTQPQPDVVGSWSACSPESVERFSAAAYYFGRHLHKSTGRPVGLIHTSIGGTPAEVWTSDESLRSDGAFASILTNWEKSEQQMQKRIEKWEAEVREAEKQGKEAPAEPSRGFAQFMQPSGAYNAMVSPLMPFAIKGVIWYQGESNANRAAQYQKLFPAMIRDWRAHWGQGDFPFLFVQLANFKKTVDTPVDSEWAELRDAQLMTLKLPNTGMAVTIDVGEADNIHPKNKQAVGDRLALAARAIAYEGQNEYSGPIFESASQEGARMRIHFQHAGSGLTVKGDELKGFAIAGNDRHFVWADAEVDGSTVIVSSKDVTAPVAVRYAWADNPICNLYNRVGLPASPFRTDDWPTRGDGK